LVPQLLEIYFDVIVNYATQQVARDLIPVIFQRLDQLFPLDSYVLSVRELLESKVLSIFHRLGKLINKKQKQKQKKKINKKKKITN